jgi:hypothetical protein
MFLKTVFLLGFLKKIFVIIVSVMSYESGSGQNKLKIAVFGNWVG